MQLSLVSELFDPVCEYIASVAPDQPMQDTVRELLLAAVMADREDAMRAGVRRAAYNAVRGTVLADAASALREIAARMELEAAGLPASVATGEAAPAVGNYLAPPESPDATDPAPSEAA